MTEEKILEVERGTKCFHSMNKPIDWMQNEATQNLRQYIDQMVQKTYQSYFTQVCFNQRMFLLDQEKNETNFDIHRVNFRGIVEYQSYLADRLRLLETKAMTKHFMLSSPDYCQLRSYLEKRIDNNQDLIFDAQSMIKNFQRSLEYALQKLEDKKTELEELIQNIKQYEIVKEQELLAMHDRLFLIEQQIGEKIYGENNPDL